MTPLLPESLPTVLPDALPWIDTHAHLDAPEFGPGHA
jgi:hypothetical protein